MDKSKRRIISSLSSFLLLLICTSPLPAQFNSLETKNLRLIYYGKIHSFLVPYTARCFENSLRFHERLFDYRPSEKITVLVHDFSDIGNAGAGAIPRNHISVAIAPLNYVYETAPANERMNATMNHEVVHIVASDQATGSDSFFRSLFFGKVAATADNPMSMLYSYLTTPRRYAPRWYHEGIAVFLETWMAGGLGRALGGYDEMVFRTMVCDSARIYDMVALESEGIRVDFQVDVLSYLYGTRFMSYLAYEYGPEKLIDWVSRTEGSKSYFAAQFKKVYGQPLDDSWSQWREWESQFQRANLDSIRQNPVTPYRSLSQNALGSVSRPIYDVSQRKMYAAVNYPGQVAHIAAIDLDTGRVEKISDIKGAALFYVSSITYDQATSTLFYTTDNYEWRDLVALDLRTGKKRMLIKDVRMGDLAFNPADKSIWGVRHYNGISTLTRVPYPYEEWNQIYSWPYGNDIYDLDVSPDGRYLTAALVEINGDQKLIKMDVAKLMKENGDGEIPYNVLFDFEISNPANFVFSPDGKYLYGSSYYTGVSNIYRYDLEADSMDIVSNCETGLFRPTPISEDSLLAFRYSGTGFVPVMISSQPVDTVSAVNYLGQEIVAKHPIVREWLAGSPGAINIDSLTIRKGAYNGFKNVRLTSAYPVAEGFKDFAALGMRFNFAGPIGLHTFDLTASYSPDNSLPDDQKVHLNFNYGFMNWKLSATYNGTDFYDLFGPTKTSRKGYSLGIQYKKSLIYDEPRTLDYTLSVAGYGDLERLPDFQNIAASFDKFLTSHASLNYKYLHASLGAVDYEKGIKWQVVNKNNYVNNKLFPRIFTNFDYGFALPVHHSSIWLRSSLGHSFGDRDEPFANFFFGGFGNNWVDHLTEKRYREYYSFPGVELNQIGGKNYGKLLVEWNLPPIRFRRLGFPAFYGTWARMALFSSAIQTNLDDRATRTTFFNVGGQIDFRLVLLSNLNSTLSFGFAAAVERGRPLEDADTEFMISLKIL